MKRKKTDGRSAEARAAAKAEKAKLALRESKNKIMAAALAGEHVRGMRAAYFLAIRELGHEILSSSHPSGPLSAISRLGETTRKAIEAAKSKALA